MMRQPNNPGENLLSIRAQAGDFASLTVTITNEQRVEILQTQGKGKPWALGEKKKLAVDVLALQKKIKDDIAAIDPTNIFDMSEKFDTTVNAYRSKTHIKQMNNDSHGTVLAPFLSMAEVILHHKEESRQQSVGGRTRRAMLQNNNNDVMTPVDILYKKCVELLEEVDAAVRKKLEAEADGADKLLKGLPIEASMVGRIFDPKRQPLDPAYGKCPWCDHCCIITAEEDDDATQYNDRKQRECDHKNRIWDDFVQRRTVAVNNGEPPPDFPTNPYDNNKPMRRAPQQLTKKQLKRPRFICTCVNNSCMMEGSDDCSSCPMKCCKVGEGGGDTERYGWIQVGNIKVCQCPLCLCPCNKVFYAGDFQRIGLALARKARQSTNEVPPEQQVSQFMGQAITAGFQAVNDIEHAGERNGWNLPNNEQYRSGIFYAGAAENMVRQSGDQLNSSALQLLQKSLGRGTNVTLPGGHSFDTNYITSNPNAHARNNRMTGSLNTTARTAAAQPPPGMEDRLNIDYTNMNEAYRQAALDPINLSSSIENVQHRIGNHPTTASTSSSAPSASAVTASHSGQSDDLAMTEEEQETFAMHASMEESFAQREDHGGKMPAQQKPALIDLSNDGKTPPPKRICHTQHPSTMSTMRSFQTASTSNQGGSALLPTFNDIGSQSLSEADVEKVRCNNARKGFSRVEKINRAFMHNDKDPKSLTKIQKAERKAAKARKKKITAVKKGGDVDIVDTMGEMIGPNEVTLSQGDNILTPNTTVLRFDRANQSSDSEEEED